MPDWSVLGFAEQVYFWLNHKAYCIVTKLESQSLITVRLDACCCLMDSFFLGAEHFCSVCPFCSLKVQLGRTCQASLVGWQDSCSFHLTQVTTGLEATPQPHHLFMKMSIQCPDFLLNYVFPLESHVFSLILLYRLIIIPTSTKVLQILLCLGAKEIFSNIAFLFQYRVCGVWWTFLTQIQSLSHFISFLNLLQICIFWLSTITLSGLFIFYVLNKLAIVE